ncbi:MAG: CpaF family protein [Eubacteriales bacterium]
MELQRLIMEHMDFTESISDQELQELIYEVLREYGKEHYFTIEERVQLGIELFNTFRKLDLIQELLEDKNTTEIMVNGMEHIFVEQNGKIFPLEKKFQDQRKLEDVIQKIVAGTNRMVNESIPIADARLEDGSRVHIVLPPIALDGPVITIRKFQEENRSMLELAGLGSISIEIIEFLEKAVSSKYNILISGGTGSGKTTFLNALSEFIPSKERIITIEDNAELQLKNIPNLVRLETRNPNVEGEGAVTIRDLIRASLRMRPDRIVVGEVRGSESVDMLMAMNTGHDGSLCTAHANTPSDMLTRLETMVLMGLDIPMEAIRRQISSAIDIIVHVGRLRDGSRKVLEVSEILGMEEGDIQLSTLYKFQETQIEKKEGDMIIEKDRTVQGTWVHLNQLVHREKLLAAGYQED